MCSEGVTRCCIKKEGLHWTEAVCLCVTVYLCVPVRFHNLDAGVGTQLLVDWLPVIDSCQPRPY